MAISDTPRYVGDSLVAASSLTLKVVVPYFVRWLPLGPRFLPMIYSSFAVYLVGFIYQRATTATHRSSSPGKKWLNVLLGWNDPRWPFASALGFAVNLLCLLAALDFVYRGQLLHDGRELSFSRVGYVDASTARITIRDPTVPVVQIEYQEEKSTRWVKGPIQALLHESDYVETFILKSLQKDTSYRYRTNSSHSGSFQTSPSHPKRWSLVSSSCIKPFYPYNPLDHSLRIRGLEYLSRYLQSSTIKPSFMLFLGDFIYIDLPRRFGFSNEHYRTAYRQVYSSPSWSPDLLSLPWIHTYDDHEITNDWSANETGLYQDAIEPFTHYQFPSNPSPYRQGATYYSFNRGDVSFFVLDTRRYRSPEHLPDGPGKTMLGAQQLSDLSVWLKTERRWKVLVSSVPFTRNWRGPEAIDSWAGYLWERQQLLEIMWASTDGVVILSGDRHEHATTTFPSPRSNTKVVEFSTSPLSQFYQPFERMYAQVEDTDVAVHYHPWGSSKFGVVTFDTTARGTLHVEFELVVDGEKAWGYNLTLP